MRFEGVVFDMDGVLADTTSCHERAYDEVWRAAGVSGPLYEVIAGRPTTSVVAEVLAPLDLSDHELTSFVAQKQRRALELLEVEDIAFLDTAAVVRDLASRGLPLAVATGASLPSTEVVLLRLGLDRVFRAIVTAGDVARGKPEPDAFRLAIERLGLRPTDVLVVEDSASGLLAAQRAGAWFASVRSGIAIGGDRFVGAFADLLTLRQELFE